MKRFLPTIAAAATLGGALSAVPGTALAASTGAAARTAVQDEVVQTRVIGKSVQGRSIVAYRMGNPAATHKVVVIGSIHGDEPAGTAMAKKMLYLWVSPKADVWVLPTVNPDGAAAGRRTNARGVDLNRNFPGNWTSTGKGTTKYSGPSAASEPETKALMAFLGAVKPTYVASFHQPLYGIGSESKNPAYVARLARNLRLPQKAFSCWSVCRGTMTGWFNRTFRGTAVTVEFGPSPVSSTTTYNAAVGTLKATNAA